MLLNRFILPRQVTKMAKYIETAKIIFKSQLAYRFDIISSMVFTVTKILLAYILWGAIFGDQNMISGFTLNSMLTYYIISSFIKQLDQSSGTGWQVADEIKNGRFSKYIIRPMGVFRYFASQTAGVSAFLMGFNFIAAVVWIFVFNVDFTITENSSSIICAFIMILLGLIFMLQLNYFIGILAFKFIDTGVFMMVKDNLVEFVTGSLIPLSILPAGIIKIMTLFPFYYITYLPSMLLMGRNENESATGLFVIIMWNILFGLINFLTFKRLRTNYDGVGI